MNFIRNYFYKRFNERVDFLVDSLIFYYVNPLEILNEIIVEVHNNDLVGGLAYIYFRTRYNSCPSMKELLAAKNKLEKLELLKG